MLDDVTIGNEVRSVKLNDLARIKHFFVFVVNKLFREYARDGDRKVLVCYWLAFVSFNFEPIDELEGHVRNVGRADAESIKIAYRAAIALELRFDLEYWLRGVLVNCGVKEV